MLPGVVGVEGRAAGLRAARIELQQFTRFFQDGRPRLAAHALPVRPAEAVERGWAIVGADVTRQAIGLVDGNEDHVRAFVLDQQVLPFGAAERAPPHAGEAADAVIDVHHEVPSVQIGVTSVRRAGAGRCLSSPRFGPAPAEDLLVAEQQQVTVDVAQAPTFLQGAVDEAQ